MLNTVNFERRLREKKSMENENSPIRLDLFNFAFPKGITISFLPAC